MNEKLYHGGLDRLRAPERLARLETDRVVALCLHGVDTTRILDVGTGTGVFAEAFLDRGRVWGLDLSEPMLTQARVHAPGATFVLGAMENLPFEDRSFELVFLGLVLHETNDPHQALAEAFRATSHRAAVLEWPHRDEPFGPPLAHRLAPAQVEGVALAVGFTRVTVHPLENLVLYLLDR